MLFLDSLRQNCDRLGDKPAMILGDETVTYADLEERIQQTMGLLQAYGIREGDRVAVQLPKCLPFVYLHLATMRLGAIMLPLNPAYPKTELRYFLEDSGASLFFADIMSKDNLPDIHPHSVYLNVYNSEQFLAFIKERTPSQPTFQLTNDQTALMIYTSGTTGRPKGAMTTHGNLTANIEGLHSAWGWREEDVILHVLPIFHVHGLVVALHGALHAGATAVMLPRFEPQATLDTLAQYGCTVFMAVPTLHNRLVNYEGTAEADFSSIRLVTSGSDRLPEDLFTQCQEIYGHTILERYGMTETGMNLSNPYEGERRIGSVGLPLPGVEARIVNPETDAPLPDNEVGEVQIRGPHVFKGYWQMAEKTADSFTPDGWLRTGDMGLREPDGYFTLKGRSKDLIITGGLNVYPPEVELVLGELSAVAASAVIGCPSDEWGETVVAVLVLKAGMHISEADVIAHCKRKLAGYKVPRNVILAEALPRNALGKVQKANLRATFCG